MREKQFVLTWWSGLVRDTFGPKSVFRVARWSSLRIGRRLASGSGGVARRGRPTAAAAARSEAERSLIVYCHKSAIEKRFP